MNKLIKIFLITLFALAISCKSNEEPASEIAGENPPAGNYTGDYSGEEGTVTINSDGSCTIEGTIIIDPYNDLNVKTTITFNITVNSYSGKTFLAFSVDGVVGSSRSLDLN